MPYCHAEARNFPDDEFVKDSLGMLITPMIHNRGVPHYSTGDPIFPYVGDPTTADLLARLWCNMLTKSKTELEAEVLKLPKP